MASWVDDFEFGEYSWDLRGDEAGANHAHTLLAELERELPPDHALHGRRCEVVAKAMPQDDIVVVTSDGVVALVHLTWSGHTEQSGWPRVDFCESADALQALIQHRYQECG
jgi:hypothetical protein